MAVLWQARAGRDLKGNRSRGGWGSGGHSPRTAAQLREATGASSCTSLPGSPASPSAPTGFRPHSRGQARQRLSWLHCLLSIASRSLVGPITLGASLIQVIKCILRDQIHFEATVDKGIENILSKRTPLRLCGGVL